jgi:NTP pyrophosphatase (non-canonical NTP hydrolase)
MENKMTYEEYLLTHLIEECSEVIKACTKCQRFGKSHFWEKEGVMNKEAVAIELGDVWFIMEELRKIGWRFDSSKYDSTQRFKRALALSIKNGCVVMHEEKIIDGKIADGTITAARVTSIAKPAQERESQTISADDVASLDSIFPEPPNPPRSSCEDCDD